MKSDKTNASEARVDHRGEDIRELLGDCDFANAWISVNKYKQSHLADVTGLEWLDNR